MLQVYDRSSKLILDTATVLHALIRCTGEKAILRFHTAPDSKFSPLIARRNSGSVFS